MESKEDIGRLIDPTIPHLSLDEIAQSFFGYGVSCPDRLYSLDKLTNEMINIINNIRNFSCSFKNLFRQVKIYFSKFISVFLYKCYDIIMTTPYRLQIILELTKTLIYRQDLLPHLFHSLVLLKKKLSVIDNIPICMFIESLKINELLSINDYEKVLKFISTDLINNKCASFLLRPPIQHREYFDINEALRKKRFAAEENHINEEEEEEEYDDTINFQIENSVKK